MEEVYVAQPNQKKYKEWVCPEPKCGFVFKNPIACYEAGHKHVGKLVQMKPVGEPA